MDPESSQIGLSKLTYDKVWGNSERKDLLPPLDVNVFYTAEKGKELDLNKFGFKVRLDTEKLRNKLSFEGVTKGRGVDVFLNMDRPSENPGKALDKGLILAGGTMSEANGRASVTVNLGVIYDLVRLWNPVDEKFRGKYKDVVANVLAHEIGHTRQPEGISKIDTKTIMQVQAGSFLIVDGARRLVLPWVGPLEPLAAAGEALVSAKISDKIYQRVGAERFANEYQRLSADQVWKDVVVIEDIPPSSATNTPEQRSLSILRKKLIGR